MSSAGMARSHAHNVVSLLSDALSRLRVATAPLEVERRGHVMNRALSSRARVFHSHEHVLDLARGSDPIGVLAALYHDVVYVQVDQGVSGPVAEILAPYLAKEEDPQQRWRILPLAGADPAVAEALSVFGRAPGDRLTPFSGLNELASAIVAARELGGLLDREQRLALAACIEATIPFREDVGGPLAERLSRLGLAPGLEGRLAARAVRFGNADVGNFAEEDPARFLDNTWRLLPEANPALHSPTSYTVSEFRTALEKMEGFLSKLPARRVFHAYGDEPGKEEHERRLARTERNLKLATRYLRQKLYSIAVVEALALATGGDMPLDYFMGGLSSPEGAPVLRIERFLPPLPESTPIDPELQTLLAVGRTSASRFDTAPSPLAAFLHASLGEARTAQGLEEARAWWAGASTAPAFLRAQPALPIAAIAEAAAHIAFTRSDGLRDLAKLLRVA